MSQQMPFWFFVHHSSLRSCDAAKFYTPPLPYNFKIIIYIVPSIQYYCAIFTHPDCIIIQYHVHHPTSTDCRCQRTMLTDCCTTFTPFITYPSFMSMAGVSQNDHHMLMSSSLFMAKVISSKVLLLWAKADMLMQRNVWFLMPLWILLTWWVICKMSSSQWVSQKYGWRKRSSMNPPLKVSLSAFEKEACKPQSNTRYERFPWSWIP